MRYRASNGVTVPVVLSQEQARAHYDQAEHVAGKWGARFVTYLIGTNSRGQSLPVAPTFYTPLLEDDVLRVEAATRRTPRARRLAEEAARTAAHDAG